MFAVFRPAVLLGLAGIFSSLGGLRNVKQRVVVFIDYQNAHGWARRRFFPRGSDPAQGHFDPLALGQLLCKRRRYESELKEVRVYRGRPNPERQAGAARANDRQTAAWERSGLVKVVRRNLSYPRDYPDRPASEKGIDVAVAVDMIRLALTEDYMDTAILLSSDKDLLPAVETLYDLQLCHIELACWAGAYRLRFDNSQLPWCHNINEGEFRTIADEVDYAAPADV